MSRRERCSNSFLSMPLAAAKPLRNQAGGEQRQRYELHNPSSGALPTQAGRGRLPACVVRSPSSRSTRAFVLGSDVAALSITTRLPSAILALRAHLSPSLRTC